MTTVGQIEKKCNIRVRLRSSADDYSRGQMIQIWQIARNLDKSAIIPKPLNRR